MRSLLKLSFIFCIVLFSAQNKEFTYEYQFISDSADPKNVNSEIMILNVGKEKSYYYSLDKYVSDSTMNQEMKKGLFAMPRPFNINEIVFKDLKNKTISFETKVGDSRYHIEQNIDLKWNLLNEFDEILKTLYNNNELTVKVSRNAREFAITNYRYNIVADKTVSYYLDLML